MFLGIVKQCFMDHSLMEIGLVNIKIRIIMSNGIIIIIKYESKQKIINQMQQE